MVHAKIYQRASVAQGIEHRSPKAGVDGSNPFGGTSDMRGPAEDMLSARFAFEGDKSGQIKNGPRATRVESLGARCVCDKFYPVPSCYWLSPSSVTLPALAPGPPEMTSVIVVPSSCSPSGEYEMTSPSGTLLLDCTTLL